ncbi:hypothetical protein [Variovorax saccharolyticus]|uniref:hypothetical protein n=1 Tax=Variovorax saccharolyticus TaxID=3053516 RepID=UPI0025760CAD|nr:hypothetical protein [Variovorax sp. J31P216]MDM0030349.1 hypothetical protein [Variovorax sp. J31P216]
MILRATSRFHRSYIVLRKALINTAVSAKAVEPAVSAVSAVSGVSGGSIVHTTVTENATA